MVTRRLAMVSNVQLLKASRIVVWTKLSVSVSIAAVVSSSIKICKKRNVKWLQDD